ncbi:hypothetical protein [Candidatus Chromulinivorax destructor]|uniref:Uncharacterized protein n=1 Tax=Candidatus Chromulinivorax destructor TaxID=2066483 RepID=A0A345ZAB4_9BACT|nr:hypothetical protein [Candidatus Chromulinivorax destructor]AXK60231.1 hypothetical protein C0J27_00500 [Candidatus Chromulinivorax destructor]
MKQLITIALGVALGIAGYVVVNRYLHTHSSIVVVQKTPVKDSYNPEGTINQYNQYTPEETIHSYDRHSGVDDSGSSMHLFGE